PGGEPGGRRDDGRRPRRWDAAAAHAQPADLDRDDDHLHRPDHRRRRLLRRAEVSLPVRGWADSLRDHADLEHHLGLRPAPVSGGLSMIPAQVRYRPDRWYRRWLGPIFAAVCLAATCSGVVVLALLLGSIVAAALKGPPDNAWYSVSENVKELIGLMRRLASQTQSSSNPTTAGFQVGIVGS